MIKLSRNTIILGKSGCGKTELSKQLALEDVENGFRILIVDTLAEYSNKFSNYNCKVYTIDETIDNIELKFDSNVNIVDVSRIYELGKEDLVNILIKTLKYAKEYHINTVYIDDLMSGILLNNIQYLNEYKDNFKIVVAIQSLSQFNNYIEIREMFKEIMVMSIIPSDVDYLEDKYYIRKHSLKQCVVNNIAQFKVFDLD